MDAITPCLWFDTEAGEAAHFCTSVFPNSRIVHLSHYEIAELERAAGGVSVR